jgi:hypothetical protein
MADFEVRLGGMLEREMEDTLRAVRDLMDTHWSRDSAQGFHDLLHDWQHATNAQERGDICRRILRLYGGMGTFNDVVFWANGKALIEENDQLEALREKLFTLARDFL